MTKSRFKYFAAAALLAVSAVFAAVPAPAFAEDKPDIYLQVSPPSFQLEELEPGESKSGDFLVQNVGAKAFDYKIYAVPYKVKNENYDINYEEETAYTQISNWFTFSQTTGSLEPGKSDKITFTVDVPENAPAGGEYAAVMVETDTGNDKNATVQTVSRVGVKIFSHVAGETKKCGNVVSYGMPTFLTQPPITADSMVENCGNVDLPATYFLQVFPLFSDEEIYTTEEKPDVLTILPETKRYNKQSWDNAPHFGIFRVKQTVKFGGNTVEDQKMVVICPVWLIVLIIALIGAIVFWLVSRNRERKDGRKSKK